MANYKRESLRTKTARGKKLYYGDNTPLSRTEKTSHRLAEEHGVDSKRYKSYPHNSIDKAKRPSIDKKEYKGITKALKNAMKD